jgi:hypothetical protein
MVTGSNLSALRTIDPTPPQPIASPPGVRVLALDPIWRAAGSISRILPLRDDALEAKLASVIEDIRAVCFQVLIQPQAQRRSWEHAGEHGLPHVQRVTPQIIAVEFDQVKGIEENAIALCR